MTSGKFWTSAILLGWLTAIGPGEIEGALFPVVENVSISATSDLKDSEWVYAFGKFEKLRECSPYFLEWRLGHRSDPITPPVDYIWGPPKKRLKGDHEFENWHVRVSSPEILQGQTFADMYHQCYLIRIGDVKIPLPWLTSTRFWN